MKHATMFMLALALAGCGALFNSGPATVMMTSSPNEADVWINGNRVGTTPLTLALRKNSNHTIVFRKDGFSDQSYTLNRRISAGYVVLDVLGGLLPVVIDAATGAWYTLDSNSVNATLSPGVADGKMSQEQLERYRRGESIDEVLVEEVAALRRHYGRSLLAD